MIPIRNQGIIKLILIFIVIVVILSLFRVNLRGYVDEKITLVENFKFVWQVLKIIWSDYIVRPALYVWRNYIEPLVTGETFSGLREKLEERNP